MLRYLQWVTGAEAVLKLYLNILHYMYITRIRTRCMEAELAQEIMYRDRLLKKTARATRSICGFIHNEYPENEKDKKNILHIIFYIIIMRSKRLPNWNTYRKRKKSTNSNCLSWNNEQRSNDNNECPASVYLYSLNFVRVSSSRHVYERKSHACVHLI